MQNGFRIGEAYVTSTYAAQALERDHPGVSINDLVCLGHGDDTQTALDQQPRRITFTGNSVVGNGLTKRGIAIHGADIMVLDNRVLNIARVGQDSSAIGGWNGEGRWTIENNQIDAFLGKLLGAVTK